MKKILALLALAAVLAILPGCTRPESVEPALTPVPSLTTVPAELSPQSSPTPVPTPISQVSVSDNTVRIKNFMFDPSAITVRTGSTVRWVNDDAVPHRILFADKADSGILSSQQSYSRRFDRAGAYTYTCTIHPDMHGTVTVE